MLLGKALDKGELFDKKKYLTLPGLEPRISCSVGRRLIHWAIEPTNHSVIYFEHIPYRFLKCINEKMHFEGSVAQWIRRLPTEQEIVGSSPAWVKTFLVLFERSIFEIRNFNMNPDLKCPETATKMKRPKVKRFEFWSSKLWILSQKVQFCEERDFI